MDPSKNRALDHCCACLDAVQVGTSKYSVKCSATEPCDHGFCNFTKHEDFKKDDEGFCEVCPSTWGSTCLDAYGWGYVPEYKL